mmetsp:Transcript_24245/g.52292  ORF Transcript_24245/g.52292 Transcript_24245/m.52292 type:complete len:207 (+) Transcript_24245:98-718(+)
MVSARSLYIGCIASIGVSSAFQSSHVLRPRSATRGTTLSDSASDVEDFLAANYPSSSNFFAKNGDVMKQIIKAEVGFTIFAPNEAAFAELGEKKRDQLSDVRNEELTGKVAQHHVILEPVTADQIFNSGGVVTEGGEVPVERSISGGMFGVGGKEDGGVTLNGAKVVKSFEFADATKIGIIHEVDGLVSPSTLWRYADQLRIPGSQ